MDKYVVLYAKVIDDKDMGALMTGVYVGGVCGTEAEADALATKCVSETQGGLIIPRIAKMHTDNIIEVIQGVTKQFDSMANKMYENEAILNKGSRKGRI